MSDRNRIDRLVAEAEIRDVLGRYCRAIDRCDETLLRSCYHPDATDEHGSFSGTVDEYVEWVFRLLAKYDGTTHMLAQSVFDWDEALRDPGVRVETYGTSTHWGIADRADLNLVTGFRFIDRFAFRDGAWRIAKRVAIAEWSRRTESSSVWPIPVGHRRGSRDHADPAFGP